MATLTLTNLSSLNSHPVCHSHLQMTKYNRTVATTLSDSFHDIPVHLYWLYRLCVDLHSMLLTAMDAL